MAFGSFDNSDTDTMSEINVTPLVDVMLVLLIVFMITMPVLTHSIPLSLPTAHTEKIQQDTPVEPIRLSINDQGDYYIGDEKIDENTLQIRLGNAHQKNNEIILAIAADKNVHYEKVTQALEIAQQAGIVKIGFITERQ